METLTGDQLQTTVYVILALLAALITVDKAIDIFKKWRTPATDTAKKLASDKERLDGHDKELARQQEEIDLLKESGRVQAAALMALLDHELHNGNTEQMQNARDEVMKYLQGLMTK